MMQAASTTSASSLPAAPTTCRQPGPVPEKH
jgi:hypothetical protein